MFFSFALMKVSDSDEFFYLQTKSHLHDRCFWSSNNEGKTKMQIFITPSHFERTIFMFYPLILIT